MSGTGSTVLETGRYFRCPVSPLRKGNGVLERWSDSYLSRLQRIYSQSQIGYRLCGMVQICGWLLGGTYSQKTELFRLDKVSYYLKNLEFLYWFRFWHLDFLLLRKFLFFFPWKLFFFKIISFFLLWQLFFSRKFLFFLFRGVFFIQKFSFLLLPKLFFPWKVFFFLR